MEGVHDLSPSTLHPLTSLATPEPTTNWAPPASVLSSRCGWPALPCSWGQPPSSPRSAGRCGGSWKGHPVRRWCRKGKTHIHFSFTSHPNIGHRSLACVSDCYETHKHFLNYSHKIPLNEFDQGGNIVLASPCRSWHKSQSEKFQG